jgi:hypothetical protein
MEACWTQTYSTFENSSSGKEAMTVYLTKTDEVKRGKGSAGVALRGTWLSGTKPGDSKTCTLGKALLLICCGPKNRYRKKPRLVSNFWNLVYRQV